MSRSRTAGSPSFKDDGSYLGSVNDSVQGDEENDLQSVLAMRKNLFVSFEKASEKANRLHDASRPPLAPSHAHPPQHLGYAKGNNSGCGIDDDDAVRGDTIPQSTAPMETASPRVSSSTTSSNTTASSNRAVRNLLAVYLRIRPPSSAASDQTDSTIEVISHVSEHASPRSVPTTVRTYPPVTSQAYKSIRQTGDVGTNKGVVVSGVKEFHFNRVFAPNDPQRLVYDEVAAPLVAGIFPTIRQNGMIKGQSALLFAYGITNAGKTYTIMGNTSDGDGDDRGCGIIPRAIDGVLEEIRRRETVSASKEHQYQLNVSFFEIYNEQVHDLLEGELPGGGSSRKLPFAMESNNLKIREDRNGHIFVQGLSKHRVTT